jgi:hypothetical protein
VITAATCGLCAVKDWASRTTSPVISTPHTINLGNVFILYGMIPAVVADTVKTA